MQHPFSVASVQKDKLLSEYAFYLRELALGASTDKLYKLNPQIFHAKQIYAHDCPKGLRWQIEALLLTGASNEEISAQYADITPQHIQTFHDIYFDVRSFLNKDNVLMSAVIGAAQYGPKDEAPWDYLWKMYAISFSFEKTLQYMSPRSTYTDEADLNWMRQLYAQHLIIHMTATSANMRKGYLEQNSELVTATTKLMQVPDNRNQLTDMIQLGDQLKVLSTHLDAVLIEPPRPKLELAAPS